MTFKKPENKSVVLPITYEASNSPNAAKVGHQIETTAWTSNTVSVDIYVKHNEEVVFENIPSDVTYTLKEDDYVTDSKGGYDAPTYKLNNSTATPNEDGVISDDLNNLDDTVVITNNKETTIDIGVILKNAPYIAMIVVVCAAGVVFVLRRRNAIED